MTSAKLQPSIRAALTQVLLLGAGVFIIAVALLLDTAIKGFLRDRFDGDMRNRAQTLITLTKVYEEGIELDFAGEFMPEFETLGGPEFFEIWLADGSLLERSESLMGHPLPVGHEFTATPTFQNIEHDYADACRVLRISFLPQMEDADIEGELSPADDPERAATLLLGRKRQDFDRLLLTIDALIWGALGALLLLIVGLVRVALRRGLRPLDDIRRQVRGIDPAALDTRIRLKKPVSELVPVVGQLNGLLSRLEEAVARERRFTSDVAHELRTPLAELRSLAEVGVKDPGDQAMIVAFFNDVREVALEMQHLVGNLLDLTRCDSGAQTTALETVELTAVVAKAWRRVETVAQRRGVAFDNLLPATFPVESDQLMVEQIVQNLLSNAVTYSPEQSEIVIEGVRSAAAVRLTVGNPAPGLTEADLPRMFERFWRKDVARTGGKNAGLGLALVASFAELLHIKVETRLDRGRLFFSLYFPVS